MSDALTAAELPEPRARRVPHGILSGPILSTLLRLALPTTVVLIAQTMVGVAETYFVSFLGTEALAGVSLVFPILMLMQMMSNGGLGGGVASAISRALGAGSGDDADALLWHSVVIACAFGILFSVAVILGGPWIYHYMGGSGQTLQAALKYSHVVFAGAIPIWITALLSSALRGAGNMKVPALVTMGGFAILVPLSPALIFGWGLFPQLGVAGGGVAVVVYYLIAMGVLSVYMRSPRSLLTLRVLPLEWRHFRNILGVGLLSALGSVQLNLTVLFVTAAVGRFGADALAGYGVASRLDYIQIPILFGIGTAVLSMVGICTGAGLTKRARRIAWTGGALSFAVTAVIGVAAFLFPHVWIGLFSDDPKVHAMAVLYFRNVAPVYGAVGLGLALYFAGQGAGRVLLPVFAGTARLFIAAGCGWLAVTFYGAGLSTLFLIVAIAGVAYGAMVAAGMLLVPWDSSLHDGWKNTK